MNANFELINRRRQYFLSFEEIDQKLYKKSQFVVNKDICRSSLFARNDENKQIRMH